MELERILSKETIEGMCGGNLGAIEPVFFLLQNKFYEEYSFLLENNIKGIDIYTLWNDCSGRDFKKFLLTIWALDSGVYSKHEIKENLNINKSDTNENEWTDVHKKYGLYVPIPFIYDKIKPSVYFGNNTDTHSEQFKEYVKANRDIFRINMFHSFLGEEYQQAKVERLSDDRLKIGNDVFSMSHINEIFDGKENYKLYNFMHGENSAYVRDWLTQNVDKPLPPISIVAGFPYLKGTYQDPVNRYYLNGNNKRFERLLQDNESLSAYSDKTWGLQGSLANVAEFLGLFSEDEIQSRRVYEYLHKNVVEFLNENTIRNYFWRFDQSQARNICYNKDFANFYMEHCKVHYDYIDFIMNGGTLTRFIDDVCSEKKLYNNAENFKILSHDEVQICDGVVLPVSQLLDIIGENEDSKFYWYAHSADRFLSADKIVTWSGHTRNKFLPSWVVVKNLPINEIANFYANNNCNRYKELIESSALNNCKSQKTFEGQEGLFKLAYMLGLFSPSAKQSQKAFEYIKTHFLNGIDGNEEEGMKRGEEWHRLYGQVNLSKGFDKNFADFFMIHYALDKNAFVDDETGVDMTGKIYTNMDKILKFRPEKEIKTTTRNKVLWPKDAIGVFYDASIAFGVELKYPELGNTLLRYGGDLKQYQWAEPLYEQALKLNEEDLSIPTVVDESDRTIKFKLLDKHATKMFVVGEKSNCCFVYQGASEKSLKNAITSKDARIIEFEAGKCYVQGWVWYDKKAETVCIDNFEGRMSKEFEQEFVLAFMDFAQKTYFAMQKNPETPCKKVNLGTDSHISGLVDFDQKLLTSGQISKCKEPARNYISELYTDAYSQYTLFDEGKAKLMETTTQINK